MTNIPNPFDITDSHTEWSATAFVMENLVNTIIKEKHYDLGPARVEKVGKDRKRPDGIIYIDSLGTRTLINIEFKQPFFDPFDFENLKEPARQKAVKRRAPYFATCNFRELVVFNTERVNKNLSEEQQIVGKYHLSEIYDLNRIEEYNIQVGIKKALEKFLEELIGDFTGKKPLPLLPLDEFLIYRLHEKIKILSLYYRGLIKESSKEPSFAKQLAYWFVDQNWSFTYQEHDYEKAARQAAYLLVNKILFYDVLRAKKSHLSKLEIPDSLIQGQILQKTLQAYFDEVLKIDYQTIYSTDFIDKVAFPENKEVIYQIKELIKILERFDFSSLGFEVIGRIFEKLIPFDERHTLGQYFTSPDVVDIILKFALHHEDDKVFDPACGAGTFLVRAYQHKKLMNQRLTHEEILKTLWGNDIAKFPAHLTTINLAINDLSSDENYPRVVKKDFFEWIGNHKEIVELPESSRKVFSKTLSDEEKQQIVPRYFDCIVGNPPYTRQEEIADISSEVKDYKENLIAAAVRDLDGKTIANISKKAGLHAYFFVHGTKFLQNNGRFGFVVSNSWLDVDYGKGLQEFFLKNYKIIAVIESKVERWFEEADINTCIVLLEKASGESKKKERNENLVKFVYLKKSLRDFIPAAADLWQAQVERLEAIDNLLKTVYAHNDLYENDDLRVFPKSQKDLWEEGFNEETQSYEGAKWGKYLKAPDIFFKILKKAKDKLVPLKEVAYVKRGFTTGANEFFYLTEEEIKRRKIEKEFWTHKDKKDNWIPNYVIKSPRECRSIVINPEDLKYRVLMIHKDKKDLKGSNVLKYIEWGERKGFNKRPTCASRGKWYDLGEWKISKNILAMFENVRKYCFWNNSSAFIDAALYSVHSQQENEKVLCGVLNSTIFALWKEIVARSPEGLGVLQMKVYDYGNMLVPSTENLKTKKDRIEETLNNLEKREIGTIFEELGAKSIAEVSPNKIKPDRRELDEIIMGEILGLSEEEQVEVYRAVIDLVKSRIEKAKSVDSRKKTKSGIDIDS
ncbi:N-6 DNA methylase, partial [Patescibacteria group bacterium]|nr:N-6 DNA methylase [Patescibacteria group bacterium]